MNTLFCTVPVSSFFSIKPALEPNFGASEVVGVLKDSNMDVIHLDLNARLNAYKYANKDNEELTDVEWNILTNILCLKEFLDDHTVSFRLHQWATHLATFVKSHINKKEIDFICFSITHTVFRRKYFAISGVLFSIILRKYLDFIPYTVPVYYGGKYMFRELAHLNIKTLSVDDSLSYPTAASTTIGFFDHLVSTIPIEYLPLYYMADDSYESEGELKPSWGSEYQFVEHVLNNLDTDKIRLAKQINKETKPYIDIKYLELSVSGTKKVKYIPDLKSLNFKDAELIVDNIFPDDFYIRFPEFKNLCPFNYYNYRFSEGCIFKCAFCYHSTVDWLLTDNVNSIVDKLEYFYDNGIEYMRFFNDNINFKLSWTKEFCNEIVKRNIKLKWSDSANLKVGDRDMFLALGEAGCIKLWYGTETYSSRILKEINKWTDKMYERIDNTLVWAHEANIWNGANLICNFPHETEEEYEQLRNFIANYYNNDIVNCMNIQPLAIWAPSTMATSPEKYQIQLLPGSMKWQGSSWGKKWVELDKNGNTCELSEVISERGDYRVKHAFDRVNVPAEGIDIDKICTLFENDYLFFMLIQIYGNDILKKKKVYHYILNEMKNNDNYVDISLNWQQSPEYNKKLINVY